MFRRSLMPQNKSSFQGQELQVRDNRPLNVQGWRKLLATDPFSKISIYIERHKINIEQKLEVFLTARL